MNWHLSHRASKECLPLADRHYNRQKIGSPQFVPPGSCVVFKAYADGEVKAFWVSSHPLPQFTKHAWAGAWVNSAFRNEGAGLSSDLIHQAISATRAMWVNVPPLGMITFIDRDKVRHKQNPGMCYLQAGFVRAHCPIHLRRKPKVCAACRSETAGGLLALQMFPGAMPDAVAPIGFQHNLLLCGGAA